MSDPKRLVDGIDLGGTLLASARGDAPSQRARERAAAALGVAVGVAAVTSGTAATGATGAMAAGTSGAAGTAGKVAVAGAWMKIVAGGLVTVAVAGGGVVAVQRSSSSTTTAPTVASTTAAPSKGEPAAVELPTPSPTSVEPPPADPIVEVKVEPPKVGAAKAASRATTATPSDPAPESALARELRSLDGARSALDRGDAAGALVALDRHDRTFPSGSLRTEAAVLRVDALLARGDTAASRKLARELLARDPAGPHARRLRSIADGEAVK